MERIPVEFLRKLGKHEIEIHGAKITVHTATTPDVIKKHIADLKTHVEELEISPKVVGVDIKKYSSSMNYETVQYMLVLCTSSRCLMIDLKECGNYQLPSSVWEFLQHPNICFVGVGEMPETSLEYDQYFGCFDAPVLGISVQELAARALNKPGFLSSSTLADIAREAGVVYEPPTVEKFEVHWTQSNMFVFTDEEVKVAVNEAAAHYQIGYKLLSSD